MSKQNKNGKDAKWALIQATAWQIAKERGYSRMELALREAVQVVEKQERRRR